MTVLTDLSGSYAIDPAHSEIGFVARHAMITKVRGSFTDVAGTATAAGAQLAGSTIAVTIQTTSVDTRNADRDAHLRGDDFFDVEKYPTITFASTSVAAADDHLLVTGDLTIKDVTRAVTIDFEFTGGATDPFGNERIGFEGSTTVNRKDFGLTWNAALGAGGVLVSEKVTLEFEISAIKTA